VTREGKSSVGCIREEVIRGEKRLHKKKKGYKRMRYKRNSNKKREEKWQ